jgi:hypothetical protein
LYLASDEELKEFLKLDLEDVHVAINLVNSDEEVNMISWGVIHKATQEDRTMLKLIAEGVPQVPTRPSCSRWSPVLQRLHRGPSSPENQGPDRHSCCSLTKYARGVPISPRSLSGSFLPPALKQLLHLTDNSCDDYTLVIKLWL